MINKHLSYRTSNPALNSNTFKNVVKKDSLHLDNTMTIRGTVDKTALALCLLVISGYYSFSQANSTLMMTGMGMGLLLLLTTIFKKSWSQYTVPLYSISQGFVVGGISYFYNSQYEGIVLQAVLLTILVLFSMLFAYRSKIIKPTENFKLAVFSAIIAILLLYVIGFFMGLFGTGLSILDPRNSSLASIGFSVFVVTIGAFSLVIDFDFIEEGAERGLLNTWSGMVLLVYL